MNKTETASLVKQVVATKDANRQIERRLAEFVAIAQKRALNAAEKQEHSKLTSDKIVNGERLQDLESKAKKFGIVWH